MSKEEKNVFENFIKKVSEFRRPDIHDSSNEEDKKYIKNIKENHKNRDFTAQNISKDSSDNDNERRTKNDFILKNPDKNKNKDKIFIGNYITKENIKEKENEKIIKCFQNYRKENQCNKNNVYTNPFFNSKNNPFINDGVKNKPFYHNSFNYSNDQNDNTNDNTSKFLENSKTSNNSDKYNQIYSSDSYMVNAAKNNKELSYINNESNEPIKEGNKLKYLLIGILGSYSAILFYYKNGKFRNTFKINSLFDSIKIFFENIKESELIKAIRHILINGIDYLVNLFNNSSDTWRLLGIFVITYLFWFVIKMIIILIIKYRKINGPKNQDEEKIESMN